MVLGLSLCCGQLTITHLISVSIIISLNRLDGTNIYCLLTLACSSFPRNSTWLIDFYIMVN
jgi:hypothetical protein